ncbi:MAG: PAS domain S-box protein [Anaerolineae bacterium]|nr:PAS domain S-box protein [Anaerolineae bacterium]
MTGTADARLQQELAALRAEVADLQRERADWRTALELLDVMVYTLDSGGMRTMLNSAHTRITGHDAEDFATTPDLWDTLIHPEDRSLFSDLFTTYPAGTAELEHFYRLRGKGGDWRWLHSSLTGVRDETGCCVRYRCIDRDITEEMRTLSALQDSEALYHSLVENLPHSVYRVDRVGRLSYVNTRYCLTVNRPREALLGKTYADLHPPEFARQYAHDDQTVIASGEPLMQDQPYQVLGGTAITVHMVKTPIFDITGQVTGLQGVFWDITERHRAEDALRRRDAILEAVAFAAERFLASTFTDANVQATLQQLGAATQASRVSIVQVDEDETGRPRVVPRFIWTAPGASPNSEAAPDTDLPIGVPFAPWFEALDAGEVIARRTEEFSEQERAMLEAQGIKSLIALPIFVWRGWWGLLTLTHCDESHDWSSAEIDALKAAADMLGAATEHQVIAQTLRDERDFTTAIIDTVGALVVVLDRQGNIVHFNHACETMTGYSADEVYQQSMFDQFIPPDELETIRVVFEHIMAGSFPTRHENHWLTRSGERRLVAWSNTALQDATGAVEYVIATGIDRTALLRAEDAEREQRTLSEALIDTIAAITSTLDLEQVMNRILQNVERVVPHEAVNIMLIEGDRVRPTYFRGYPQAVIDHFKTFAFSLDTPNLRRMAESGEPFLVQDTTSYPGWVLMPATDWVRSYIGAPIRVGDDLIGFVSLDSATPDFFTPEHAERLKAFADQAAIAIRNAQLFQESRRRADELEALRRLTLDISSQLAIDDLLETLVRNACTLLDTHSGGLYVYRPERDCLEWTVSFGSGMVPTGAERRRGEGLSGKVWESGQPMIIDSYATWPGRAPAYDGYDFGAVMAVPVRWGDEFLGVLNATTVGDQSRHFSEQDVNLLSRFADQAAIAIINARLFAAEQDQRQLAEALRDTAAIVNSTLDLDEVLDHILDAIGRVVPHEAANILLIEEADVAHMRRARGYEAYGLHDDVMATTFPVQLIANLRRLAETGEPIAIADVREHTEWTDVPPVSLWIRSYAGAPILVKGECVGFINLDSSEPGFFSQADAAKLKAFADQIATAIENAQLYETTRRHADELTRHVRERTREFQQVKERVETILNSSSDAIILLDADGTINQVNPAFDEAFAYERDEAFGQPLAILAAPEHAADLTDTLHDTVSENRTGRLAFVAQRKDDSAFDADIVMSPLQAVEGKEGVWGVVCSVRDITMQKRTEEQMRRALQSEKELSELRSRFVSTAAHEFSTPLSTIRSAAFLLEKRTDRLTAVQRHEQFRKIRVAIDNMAHLMDEILIIGRAEAGRLPYEPAPLDLEALCRDIIEQVLIGARPGFRIQFHPSGPCQRVLADEKLLRHILTNLLSNAVKYSPDHDTATLDVACDDEQVMLRVADQGIGIPPEDQAQLFEAFQRASNVTDFKGSGLGLAITRQAVERHGGTITFTSQVGAGTTFEVILPITPPGAAPGQIEA